MSVRPSQQSVTDQLKAHGASVFLPLIGANDLDLAVRGEDGQYVEVRILAAEDGVRAFTTSRFRPKPHVFFICVESEAIWIIPSHIFERFASGALEDATRTLDLNQDDLGETLGDRLDVYQDRWVLITNYSKYRSTLSDPISLQMLISMD